MSEPTLKYTRQSNCPPEVDLDRFHLGELPRKRRRVMAAHLDGCPDCSRKLAERDRGLSAFPELDAGALSRRIRESADDSVVPEAKRALADMTRGETTGRRLPAWLMAAAAAVAVALLVVFFWVPGREQPRETVRLKGSVKLQVHRKQDQGSVPLASGVSLPPGVRLKFEVSLPGPGHLMVVGVEAGGETYTAYPLDGSRASVAVQAMTAEFLPGAVELDESPGEEWLHLVVCPRPFDLQSIQVPAAGELKPPAGCLVDSFRMKKESP